jgi:hypothetical protein
MLSLVPQNVEHLQPKTKNKVILLAVISIPFSHVKKQLKDNLSISPVESMAISLMTSVIWPIESLIPSWTEKSWLVLSPLRPRMASFAILLHSRRTSRWISNSKDGQILPRRSAMMKNRKLLQSLELNYMVILLRRFVGISLWLTKSIILPIRFLSRLTTRL